MVHHAFHLPCRLILMRLQVPDTIMLSCHGLCPGLRPDSTHESCCHGDSYDCHSLKLSSDISLGMTGVWRERMRAGHPGCPDRSLGLQHMVTHSLQAWSCGPLLSLHAARSPAKLCFCAPSSFRPAPVCWSFQKAALGICYACNVISAPVCLCSRAMVLLERTSLIEVPSNDAVVAGPESPATFHARVVFPIGYGGPVCCRCGQDRVA